MIEETISWVIGEKEHLLSYQASLLQEDLASVII